MSRPAAKPKEPQQSPTVEEPPNISEFLKWLGYHLVKDWPTIWKAPIGFIAVFIGAILSAWALIWNAFVPQKDMQLNTKQERIELLIQQKEEAEKENEKLSKQIEELRIYRGQDGPPLKRKALILAQQIREFTKNWKDSDDSSVQSENVNNYLKRFGLRASIIRDDLDQYGQQSDAFDKVMYEFSSNYSDVRTIAAEVEKLANNLQ